MGRITKSTQLLLLTIFALARGFHVLPLTPVISPIPSNVRCEAKGDSTVESKESILTFAEEYGGYSNSLSKVVQERKRILQELEPQKSIWSKLVRKLAPRGRKARPGSLVVMRCCESTFNLNQTFTGWLDPPLSDMGVQQSQNAARLLVSEGFDFDVVYTSRLKRSISTAWHTLEIMDSLFIPMYKTYRLNQRMYGALEGISKEETVSKFGINVVDAWRNSMKAQPPKLSRDDPSHPINDRKYADVPIEAIPDSESLLECQKRAEPLWEYQIKDDIRNGKNVLVVAHRDTIRGLLKIIDGIDDEETIGEVSLPRGIPMVYRFDEKMEPIEPSADNTHLHTNGLLLEKPRTVLDILEQESVPMPDNHDIQRRELNLKDAMVSLRYGEELKSEDVGPKVNGHRGITKKWSDDPCEFEEYDVFAEEIEKTLPNVMQENDFSSNDAKEGPFVVLIRHGRTQHNQMQLFTGWEDPPLADKGVDDAKNAGRLLRKYGFEFDVVYTSWLTRAIQTAYYAMEELDQLWLPMVKSWRLNERFYSDLTGKSKKMIANQYGEEQLKKWR